MVQRALLLVVLTFLLLGAAQAQFQFDSWTADNGLPQNSVYGIAQTRDGYIWLATVDGLARFDGLRFTVFNKSNSPGIVNNRFVDLFEDGRGDLWGATEESGVVRLHNGRFTSYGEADGIPRIVSWVVGDGSGDPIFVSGSQQLLFSFHDGKFFPFNEANRQNGADVPHVGPSTELLCWPKANELIITRCLDNGEMTEYAAADGASSVKLQSAARDTQGTVWLITEGKVARVVNKKAYLVPAANADAAIRPLRFVSGSELGLLSEGKNGSLWLTNLETMQTHVFSPSLRNTEDQNGLVRTSGGIHTAFEDSEGNVWLGTIRRGLIRARKQAVTSLSTDDGLTDNNVYPIYQDSDGTIWVGTTKGLFTYANGRFEMARSTGNFYVQAIGSDAEGRVIVSDSHDLYIRDADGFKPFLQEQIPQGTVNAIHTDADGTLWIGNEGGLTRYREGESVRTYTPADGLAGKDVKRIINAKSGGLWIGTYDGLSRIDNDRITTWREADGLPSRTVRDLYEDLDGALWIGTYDGGLARFKDGKLTRFDSGLRNDGAFRIIEDERGQFWISSNRGIYRVSKDELNEFADGKRTTITSVSYGKSDGMLNAECNGGRSPGGIKTNDGKIWFPTQDGVAIIDPNSVRTNSKPPPVVIEKLTIDNADTPLSHGSGSSDPPLIEILPEQQNFEIQYTALSFVNSQNLRFKYRLEGLDAEWIDAGTRRIANFSHVPPGNYRFRVIAANSDGVWNLEGKSLSITVLPPFYRTWAFTLLIIALVIAATVLVYWWRISQLHRETHAQEALSRRLIDLQENERKRIAGELHDGLSQNLVIIKNRAMMSLADRDNVGHAFDQIEEIAEAASESLTEVREIAANLRPFQIDRLGITKAIEALVRKTRTPQLNIVASLDSIDGLLTGEMEINLYRILQESLNNVIKHSGATEASVTIERSGRFIDVEVRDNGQGFETRGGYDTRRSMDATGFGLLGMSERARILGSNLDIESSSGKGTRIGLRIGY
jgi:signal transduction histidine kinase/ligand-binding sensor domain-containing protein